MTTISYKRRNKGRGVRVLLIGLLCVIVAGILVVWREPLSGVFWGVFSPAFGAVQALVTQGEVARLRTELVTAQALAADRDLLATENRELKARLGRVPPGDTTLLATVLVRPPATPYDTLMLDVGFKDGVAVGDLVFAGGSVAIGQVTEVYRTTARATLLSAPGASREAILHGSGVATPVVLEGQGGGAFMAQVPQGVVVMPGDSVTFPSLMPVFVAQVAAVEAPAGASFQTVYLQLPVNPLLLQYVEVRNPAL